MRRALGFAVVLAAFVTPLSASLTPSVAAGSLGLDALDTCLAQKSSLSVLFLVDTSQSLKQTDPTAQRVQGLQAALRALSTLKTSTEAAKQSLSIFVDFLEFGSISRRTFADSPEWQPLPDDSSALETAVSVYANKTQAEDTDYVSALEPWADRSAKPADQIGALELLGRAPADSCRLVVWFTDGKLELDYQHTPKTLHWVDPPIQLDSEASQKPAEAAARDELCKSGGLADRLRTGDLSSGEGAALAVVGLGSSTSFDLISSIAQGSGQGGPCGSAAARGVFLPADSLDLLSFDLITAVLGRGDGSPVGTTGIGSCAAGDPLCTSKDPQVQVFDFPFVLNGGLVKFNLVTLAGDPSVTATLISPDMSEYELGKTESTVLPNGVALQVANVGSSGAVHQIDATLPGDQVGWQGLWRVRYRTSDPAKAAEILNKAAIFVFGNLQAKLDGPPILVGKTGTITVSLVSAAGQPATDTAFATGSKLIVTANGQALPTPAINADGTFVYPYTVPDGFTGDSIALSATLDPIIRLSSDAPDVHLPTWQGDLGTIKVVGRGDGSPVGTTGIGSCAAGDPLCTSKDPQVQVFDFPFVLNGGLVKFNLVTLAGDPSVTATLISPDMSEYELGKTESTVLPNGVALQVANVGSSGAVHQIDATLPGDQVGWQGLWRVRYRTSDPAKAAEILNKAAIFVFGNLQAKLDGPPILVGKTGTITVSLVSAAGQPATDTAFATGSKLIVTANGQALPTPAINADGTFVYPYTVPDGFTGDSIALSATLDPIIRLSSDAPDVHLPTWQGDLGTINVLPVSKFPFITLKSSSLGTFDQKHRTLTTTVEIDATAPDSGGCVSVGTAFTFLPFKGMKGSPSVQLRDGSTRIDDHASCAFKINTGEKKDITLVVSLGHATFVSEGTLQASGVLHSVNATDGTKNGDAPIVVSAKIIPITISTTDWGKVVLYTIFAVLIPILLLFIYNVFTAKLAVGESQRESAWLLELPTRLRDGRLVRLDGVTEVPLVADDDDFRRIPGPGTSYARSVDAGKVAFRARIPMSPFGDIVAVVDGGDASFVVGPLGSTRRGSRGKMPLTTVRAWGFTSSETPVRIKDTAALEPLDGTLSILLPFSMSRAREEVATIRPDLDEIIQSSALRSATVSAPERASEEPDIEAHADRKRRRIRPSKTESPKAPKNANEDPFGDTNERDGDPFGDNSSGRVDRNRSSSSNDDGSDSAGGSRSDDVPF